jgi:hypothetical protein
MELIMRRRSKYKQTLLSTLFIEAFFLLLGRAVAPIPMGRLLVDIVSETI